MLLDSKVYVWLPDGICNLTPFLLLLIRFFKNFWSLYSSPFHNFMLLVLHTYMYLCIYIYIRLNIWPAFCPLVSLSVRQSFSPSVHQFVSSSVLKFVSSSVHQSVSPSVSLSIGLSVRQSVNASIGICIPFLNRPRVPDLFPSLEKGSDQRIVIVITKIVN